MVEAKWMGVLLSTLAWGSLAWSQAPAPVAAKSDAGRVITVQEFGKQPQQCRVLKSWSERDGATVFEVQVADTTERMTIVESAPIGAPGAKSKAMTSRIYHWMQNTPPPGTPLPPSDPTAPSPLAAAPVTQSAVTVVPAPEVRTAAAAVPATPPQADKQDEPNLFRDWHLSWGKADDHKSQAPVADLPHADSSKPDPLSEPENYSTRPLDKDDVKDVTGLFKKEEERLKKEEQAAAAAEAEKVKADAAKPETAAKADPVKSQTAKVPPKAPATGFMAGIKRFFSKDAAKDDKDKPPSPEALEGRDRVYPGAGSVTAAGGKNTMYVPVPIMTMPPTRTPQGIVQKPRPMNPLPAVPASNVENAFTTAPPPPPPQADKADPEVVNAFTTVVSEPPPESVNGFGSPRPGARSPQGMVQGMPPQGMMMQRMPQGVMAPPQGMVQGMPPQGMMMQTMPQGMVAPQGMVQMPPQGMMTQRMPAQGMVQMPPQGLPMAQTVIPAGAVVETPVITDRGPSTPASALRQPMSLPTTDMTQMLLVLRNSLYPSHREWAADHLATVNWNSNPYVVEGLMQAAREDPAASVRAACIRSLGKMNVNTMTVLETLQKLKADQDPQVRQEAAETLTKLAGNAQ